MAEETQVQDPYAPEDTSGDNLPDEFDATIRSSRFMTRENYRDGEVPILVWEVQPDNDPNVEMEEIRYGVGPGWTIQDTEGARIGHDFGRRAPHNKTAYGMVLNRCSKELANIPRNEHGHMQLAMDPANDSCLYAPVWVGKTFHFKREKIVYEGLKDEERPGQDVESERLMPVEFISPDQVAARVPVVSSAAPSSTPASPAASSEEENTLRITLIALASSKDNASEFIVAAIGMGITKYPALEKEVLDGSPSGFYAQTQK